jgi:hypothetical protein
MKKLFFLLLALCSLEVAQAQKKFSDNDSRYYYVNKKTKKRQWAHPMASKRSSM